MEKQKRIAIRVEGVKKKYRLGAIGGRTLQADLQSWWARKCGKEDPNLKIGTDARQLGEEFMALNGVDLTVYKGERIGIIGMNGAGKSTLLKLLSRITAPTEGDIYLWGRVSSLLEIGTGFHRELTGRENIYMNGAILGMKQAEIDAKLQQIIAFSEIENYIDTPVKRYSSGMFVKLAFAVAAFLNSDILIMDEVLAVGDMAFQRKCLEKMRRAADDEGKTILYVSHNMETIRRLCDRCVVLDQGRIIYDGDVEPAIALYLNRNLGENAVDIDLSAIEQGRRKTISLEHLRLVDRITPVYRSEDVLVLQLRMEVRELTRDLFLRLTFRSDSDVGIGTAWSQPFSPEPGTHELLFSFPLTALAKGSFYVSMGVYQTDEVGRRIPLSHVTRAFRIEIEGLPIWNTTAHGYVQFETIRVDAPERR